MSSSQQEMIEYTIQDIIFFIMDEKHISMEQAMDDFYLSETFEKLNDIETGLYLEGSDYIYELFKREKTEILERLGTA